MIHTLKLGIALLCIGGSLACYSQEKGPSVISPAGEVSKGGGIILEWTVGEPAIETVSTSSALYTQGFHQPVLHVQKLTTGKEVASLQNKILVYPNPATSVINVQLDNPFSSALIISLIDEAGKQVSSNRLPAQSSLLRLNIGALSSGVYILRITDAKGSAQNNYKIIKSSK